MTKPKNIRPQSNGHGGPILPKRSLQIVGEPGAERVLPAPIQLTPQPPQVTVRMQGYPDTPDFGFLVVCESMWIPIQGLPGRPGWAMFQYLPQLSHVTSQEEADAAQQQVKAARQFRVWRPGDPR